MARLLGVFERASCVVSGACGRLRELARSANYHPSRSRSTVAGSRDIYPDTDFGDYGRPH
ncbi:hypothetical protein [Nocardia sp. NPDC050435]|uniref:hypothetical protein n=1 Tax=Nocardia sp. NPDC050435 TaxID=3155040 RepID=UPI0033E3AF84